MQISKRTKDINAFIKRIDKVTISDSTLPEVLRPKHIKQYYGMGNTKLQELLERRDFPSYKIDRDWYIIKNDFLEWEKNGKSSKLKR